MPGFMLLSNTTNAGADPAMAKQDASQPSLSVEYQTPSKEDREGEQRSGSGTSVPGVILFAGGAALTLFTSALTRKALVRRYRIAQPPFYRSNNAPPPKTNGFPDAIEALTVATLNVCSWATMLAGGWMWALQIRNLEDLRQRLRSKIGGGANPATRSKQEVEEEIEEWVARVLARKAEKDRRKREQAENSRSKG